MSERDPRGVHQSGRDPISSPQFSDLLSNESFRAILNSIADGILILDPHRRIIYLNQKMAEYIGHPSDRLLGMDCQEVVGYSHCHECPHAAVYYGSQCFTGHDIHGGPSPENAYCVSASPLRNDLGEVIGIIELYRDMRALGAQIREMRDQNAALELERSRLDDVLRDSSDGYFSVTTDRTILKADDKLLELLGKTRDEVVGRPCPSVFGSDKCDRDCPLLWAVDRGQNVIDCREMIHAPDGLLPVDKSIFLHRDTAGEVEHLVGVLRNASEIVDLRRTANKGRRYAQMVSANAKMEQVFEMIDTFGPTDASILILGESGTGKELVANAIQESSLRRKKPFLKINCSALAEGLLESEMFGHVRGAFTGAVRDKRGKFEVADGGTIFLDEVGDMSPALQTKLLRVLEAQEFEPVGSTSTVRVDVRVVAATNRDLGEMIRLGKMRDDLYYRLNAIQIHLPPLRERVEDIPLLVNRFLGELEETYSKGITRVSTRALEMLQSYDWPGNIRELRNAIQFSYVCATGDRVERASLPPHIRETAESPDKKTPASLRSAERESDLRDLLHALQVCGQNRTRAAKMLGISRTTLWRRMRELGVATRS